MRANLVMGTAESKGSHRHRSGKHPRHKHEVSTTHKCQHKNKPVQTLMSGNRKLSKGKNETIGREFRFCRYLKYDILCFMISTTYNIITIKS
jgi:hypothetical protein